MKKLILAIAVFPLFSFGAFAADLPNTKGAPSFAPPPPPAFTWTGFYIGAQAGYEWGVSDPNGVTYPGNVLVAAFPSYDDQGVVGGGHIGFNYQVSQFVFGIEGDLEGSSYSGSKYITAGGLDQPLLTKIPIQGSIRGRAGWAWDRLLIYGTGGVAFASIHDFTSYTGCACSDSATTGRVGWTAGGGVEYALDPNWSVRAEYRYTDYGSYDFVLANTAPGFAVREHERDNRVEAGFSYKFDMFAPPMPVVAKY